MKVDLTSQGLTSLVGVPFSPEVRELNVSSNRLTTLVGCPSTVTKLIAKNNSLLSLEGCPSGLSYLDVSNNQLSSVRGCAPTLTILLISNNRLETLEGCTPLLHLVQLYCSNNRLTSLRGVPAGLTVLACRGNEIDSLSDVPRGVRILDCHGNKLLSLQGCPPVKRLACGLNPLLWLGLPATVTNIEGGEHLPGAYRGKSLEEIRAIDRSKKQYARKIQRAWRRYWYTPNKEGEAPCAKRSYQRDILSLVPEGDCHGGRLLHVED